jgi:hypothetical protein
MSKRSAAIVAGASVIGLGVAVLIDKLVHAKPAEGKQYTLSLEATKGGTTNPKPGYYTYDSPTSVTVTAIPESGYLFDGWYLSGEKVDTGLTYTVDVSGNVLLVASFVEEGAPPLIPAYIRPTQNCSTEEWWRARKQNTSLQSFLYLEQSKWIGGYVKFKICDAAGNGVKGQSIAIYTDPNPDELSYGYVYLNDAEHTSANPLILTSDAEGVVSVKVTYKWIEPNSNYQYTIGQAAKAHWVCLKYVWEGDTYPIYDGATLTIPCYWESITRLRHPIYRNPNYIHAYWVDNPSLPVWGDAMADCMIKIEDILYT